MAAVLINDIRSVDLGKTFSHFVCINNSVFLFIKFEYNEQNTLRIYVHVIWKTSNHFRCDS